MIKTQDIVAWGNRHPWSENFMVEQDLIISRALVAIFGDEFLSSRLAFRGGTALNKLFAVEQPRYSEDIDLVQITAGPIKDIMFRLGEVLAFLPDRRTEPRRFNNTMKFRMESEIPPVVTMRLKVEINCFEHFAELGFVHMPFTVSSGWFSGGCDLTTYNLNELLGTKLRALYQRRKGRDLFDLDGMLSRSQVDPETVLQCFRRYILFSAGRVPTKKQFLLNMVEKLENPEFLADVEGLLRPGLVFDPHAAWSRVKSTLIDRLP